MLNEINWIEPVSSVDPDITSWSPDGAAGAADLQQALAYEELFNEMDDPDTPAVEPTPEPVMDVVAEQETVVGEVVPEATVIPAEEQVVDDAALPVAPVLHVAADAQPPEPVPVVELVSEKVIPVETQSSQEIGFRSTKRTASKKIRKSGAEPVTQKSTAKKAAENNRQVKAEKSAKPASAKPAMKIAPAKITKPVTRRAPQ